ncbi:MAG TPA: ABC transporter permease [Pseudoclavibacter sp.]|nr:ABC transporter permease [Pseudoclavibacter sp.]
MSHPVAIEVPPPPLTHRRGRRKFRWSVSLAAAPLAAYLFLFFIVPFGVILWYSFGTKPEGLFGGVIPDTSRLSFDRYVEVLTNPDFFTVFTKTLWIAIIGSVLTLLIAYPIAYWMARVLSPRSRNIVLMLVLIPYWTNFLIRTLGWQIALNQDGFISHLLQSVGILHAPLEFLYTTQAVQLGVVYNYLPLMILPLYVTLEQMDWRLLEANSDLGGNAWSGFRKVTLPLSMPGIGAGLMLVFVPLMGDYITPSILGGAKGTMVGQLVAGPFTSTSNWALGSAMAVILMLMILFIVIACTWLLRLLSAVIKRANRIVVPALTSEGTA